MWVKIMSKPTLIERPDGEVLHASYKESGSSEYLVILVHGFPKAQSDTSNLFGFLAEEVLKYGASSLLFDYSSCDYKTKITDGFCFESAHKDLDIIYEWAKEKGFTNIGIIAEGLGAPIILTHSPENCFMGIFFWPAFNLQYVHDTQFNAAAGFARLETDGYINYNQVRVGKALLSELTNIDLKEALNNFTAPTLILHGDNDVVIPAFHLDIAREDLMSRRLEITIFEGGEYGLERTNDRKATLMHIGQFLHQYTPSQK